MAINLPSDLLIDVTRAADPDAFQMATQRLEYMSATAREGEGYRSAPARSFSSVFDVVKAENRHAVKRDAINPAYQKFEAFMLQSFVQSMFTSETTATFGKGVAGEHWKSMMAEAIANKMAETGGVGIAQMLERQATSRIPPNLSLASASLEEINSGATKSAASKNMVHEIERKMIRHQLESDDAALLAGGAMI